MPLDPSAAGRAWVAQELNISVCNYFVRAEDEPLASPVDTEHRAAEAAALDRHEKGRVPPERVRSWWMATQNAAPAS